MQRLSTLLVIHLAVLVAAAGCATRKARDFDAWVRMTQRPGFTRLDAKDVRDYHIAVYDTGKSELALCYQWHGSEVRPDMAFHVEGANGAKVRGGEVTTDLTWERRSSWATTVGSDGLVIAIRRDYAGPLKIQITDARGLVYFHTVTWRGSS